MKQYRILEIVKEKYTLYKLQYKFLWFWLDVKYKEYGHDYKGRLCLSEHRKAKYFKRLDVAKNAAMLLNTPIVYYKSYTIKVAAYENSDTLKFIAFPDKWVFSTVKDSKEHIDKIESMYSNKTIKVNLITLKDFV
jgi:hypothetical protein